MRSFYLLLALLPLTIASYSSCECSLAKCSAEQPAKCSCENANAIRCAKNCGRKPTKVKSCAKPTSCSTPTPTPTICGSRGLPPCAIGQTCIPNPSKPGCDPRADCPGICAVSDSICDASNGFTCPLVGQTCIDNPNDACDPTMSGLACPGICAFLDPPVTTSSSKTSTPTTPTGAPCGGFAGFKCPSEDQICIDNPNDSCDPTNGGADCIGICVASTSTSILSPSPGPTFASCGGFVGQKCTGVDQKCVDDPRDSCDPMNGGADCSGICVDATYGL